MSLFQTVDLTNEFNAKDKLSRCCSYISLFQRSTSRLPSNVSLLALLAVERELAYAAHSKPFRPVSLLFLANRFIGSVTRTLDIVIKRCFSFCGLVAVYMSASMLYNSPVQYCP